MNWTCQYCNEELLSAHKSRHLQRRHPEHFIRHSNKGDSMCPLCHKIMHKTNVKRHMILVHKAHQDINIGQLKKQIVETNCSIQEFSNQCSLSVPIYWILTFIVLTKLWKLKKYVQTSDVISSMYKFLKKIGFKSFGNCREFLQCLSCYCYIKFAKTSTTVEDQEQEKRLIIKHITKGNKYLQLLRQIHSNAGTFRYWQICHRMSFKTPVMRFNKEEFKSDEMNSFQSDSSQVIWDQSNFDSFNECIESSAQPQIIQQNCFTTIFNQLDENLWQFKKQFDQYCLNGKRAKAFLKKLDKFDKKEELLMLLKQCNICKQKFTQNEMKRLKCIYCLTQIHEQCFQNQKKCACQSQNIQPKRIFEERLLQKSYQTVLVPKNELWSRKAYQGIKVFDVSDPLLIQKEVENIQKALWKRDQFIYSPQAKISRQFNAKIDLSFDPFISEADEELTRAYRMYADGSYKAPMKLKIHGKDNYGIQALETIPKMTLLGEYAADIIPSVLCAQLTWKNHLMLYHGGATSDQELVLAPINICNFGPLLNHSDEGNCSSLRVIIDDSIRVLLYTTQKVAVGEELLYNYNGFHNQYPTDGFEQFND